jgi:hypothetical protein
MRLLRASTIAAASLLALLGGTQPAMSAESETGHGHRGVPGQIIQKGNGLAVQTQDGATFMLEPNQRQSELHGHAPFKAGDEVTVTLNENNMITEIHPKGEASEHRFVSGKLVYVGKMKSEIKLQTDDGEQTFPLDRQELKTKPIEEGSRVTVELNEAGRVIDLHREGEQGKH